MKPIPFVSNHPDNMHCVNAVFRMVHQYFFNEDLTWEEIDSLSKSEPGKGTWTIVLETEFVKKGLKIIDIDPLDYQKLYEGGVDYLVTRVGKKTADYYVNKSNISAVIEYIPEHLKNVKHEIRRASVKEIIGYLKTGALVGAEINSRILNNKAGFSLHFVLLYDFDGENIILHDPGLPPIMSRKTGIKEFDACFNFPGANAGITVFSK